MQHLLEWALDKGARVTKLQAEPERRHFVVSEDVGAGDTVIALPQDLLLRSAHAFEDAEYKDAFRQLADELRSAKVALDDRHFLCILLVLEKARQGASDWEPYISVLPEQYDDPYWWHEEQLKLLKGTRLSRAVSAHHHGLQSISACIQRLAQLYSKGRPSDAPPSVLVAYRNGWALKLQAARWARSTVWSRSFTVRQLANGARNVVAMVPVLDMIDHSPDVEVVWHTGRDGTEPFQFMPLSAVNKGAIMSNNYGRKSSDELLLAYGFLLDRPNPSDHLIVTLAHSRLGPGQANAHTGGGGANGAVRMQVDGEADDCEEDQAQQQAATEDLQRALALSGLGLETDQKLSLAEPLPAPLLLGAQLCLLPVPQLYLWMAQMQTARCAHGGVDNQHGNHQTAPSIPNNSHTVPHTAVTQGATVQGLQATQGVEREAMDTDGSPAQVAGHKRPRHDAQGDAPTAAVALTAAPRAQEAPALAAAAAQDAASAHPSALEQLLHADSAMHIRAAPAVVPAAQGVRGSMADEEGSGRGSDTDSGEHQRVHLLHRLQALVSMREQLQARLTGMASDAALQAAHAHGQGGSGPSVAHRRSSDGSGSARLPTAPSPALLAPSTTPPLRPPGASVNGVHESTMQGANNAAGQPAQAPQGLNYHSHLAATYVSVQKSLIRHSLQRMSEEASAQVQAAGRVVRQAVSDAFLSMTTLAEAAAAPLALPALQAQASLPTMPTEDGRVWSCIDPDLHIRCYTAWLQTHGLLHPSPTCMDGEDGITPMSDGVDGLGAGGCGLQEVVFRRRVRTAFLSRRSSREGSFSGTTQGPLGVSVPAPQPQPPPQLPQAAAAAGAKPVNGRRAPPSASRTFTMKGAPAGTTSNNNNTTANNSKSVVQAGGNSMGTGQAQPHAPCTCKRVALPSGLAASIGCDSSYDPLTWGAIVTQPCKAGEALMRVPAACCLIAPSQEALVGQLMVAASRVLQSLLIAIRPHIAVPAHPLLGQHGPNPGLSAALALAMATAPVALTHASDMLVWHLMHVVASPPSARVMSDVEGVQLLAEMLEDSPAGTAYQEAFDTLKQQYSMLRRSAVALAAVNAAGASSRHTPGTNGKAGKGDMLQRLLSLPSTFSLFTWAAQVIDRCALRATDGRWVLAPVVCGAPAELRPALLDAEITTVAAGVASDGADGGLHVVEVRSLCDLSQDTLLSPLSLLPGEDLEQVMLTWGAEALPWQALLHQSITKHAAASAILPRTVSQPQNHHQRHSKPQATSTHQVPIDGGTQGAHAADTGPHASLDAGQAGSTAQQCVSAGAPLQLQRSLSGGHHMLHGPHGSHGYGEGLHRHNHCGARGSSMAALLTALGYGPTALYELYVCPGERDPRGAAKLQLLTATGLGCVHFLTEDLSTELLVMSALNICLANSELLNHPLAQQCLSLYAAWRAESTGRQSSGGAADDAAAVFADGTAPASSSPGAASSPGKAGSGAAATHAPLAPSGGSGGGAAAAPAAMLAALADAQARFLAFLREIPDDHAVCRAARKQLRTMVHDARKNTRRRLKQLEAVHNVVESHLLEATSAGTASSARSATYGCAGGLGGSFHYLGGSMALHDGVRLYLGHVCSVLDAWGDHLGLNRPTDSMSNKRHKSGL